MRVAFLITSLANKGPVIMLRALVGHLVQHAGYHCKVYYFDDLIDLEFDCEVKQISFFDPIEFHSFDIIHSHLFRPDLYCLFHHQKIKKSNVKLVSTIHTAIYDDLAFTYGRFTANLLIPAWKLAWKKMDHVVVLSQAAKDYYRKTKFKALSVISNGINIPSPAEKIPEADLAELLAFRRNHILLGTVCSMDKRKGLEQIIKLLAIKQEYAFLVIGDGMERAGLMELAIAYKVSNRFKIMGFRADGYRYIPHFDMYVLPSRSEGMPLALLEVMALNVPLVCSAIPSLAEQFGEDFFYYFKLDDIAELKLACESAEKDAGFRSGMALKFYSINFTSEKMGTNYSNLYNSLLNIP